MRRTPESHYRASNAAGVLRKIFGSHRAAALWVVVVLISLNWFASGIQRIWTEWPSPPWRMILLETAPGLLLLGGLYCFARQAPDARRPRIVETFHPAQVKVLVIFLSSPWKPAVDESLMTQADGSPQRLTRDFLDSLERNPWRMPLEAIAYHARKPQEPGCACLERVVVIPSHDRPFEARDSGSGTFRQFELFREIVHKLTSGDTQLSEFKVESLHWLISGCIVRRRAGQSYAEGVDFESPKQLEEAIFHIYDALYTHGFDDRDVLVDVTGGQKPASIGGAVVALGKDRRIQYVSTHDYQVRAYDVTFDD